MKHKKQKLITLLLFSSSICITGLQAQETVLSAGGQASGSGGTAAYSAGQVVYTTNTGTNGSVAQGVQQSYEISVESGIEEAKEINLMVSAYPNPTTDFLQLIIDASTTRNSQSLSYKLFEMNGKLIQNKKIDGNEVCIDMSGLISATYFLIIEDTHNRAFPQEVKTFKIIKTQ